MSLTRRLRGRESREGTRERLQTALSTDPDPTVVLRDRVEGTRRSTRRTGDAGDGIVDVGGASLGNPRRVENGR